MKRELKKLFDKNRVITNEWYLMTIENSTAEEREEKWNELQKCRYEIMDVSTDLLGIKTREQAIVFSESTSRSTICRKYKNQ